MSYCLPFVRAAAACVIPALAAAAPVAAEELPGGGSAVFRERMLDREGTEVAAAPVAVRIERRAVGDRMALPRLSSRFGYREHPILGRRALHAGIDIPGPSGTPVQASESGIVSFAGQAGGYGEMVEIDHGNGLRTRYAHLSRMAVRSGMAVQRGETIGLMGSTGRSTGSHLHFEVRVNGRPADPLGYFGRVGTGAASPFVMTGQATPPEPHISAYAKARAAAAQVQGAGL